jgi:hypothetical protein
VRYIREMLSWLRGRRLDGKGKRNTEAFDAEGLTS